MTIEEKIEKFEEIKHTLPEVVTEVIDHMAQQLKRSDTLLFEMSKVLSAYHMVGEHAVEVLGKVIEHKDTEEEEEKEGKSFIEFPNPIQN